MVGCVLLCGGFWLVGFGFSGYKPKNWLTITTTLLQKPSSLEGKFAMWIWKLQEEEHKGCILQLESSCRSKVKHLQKLGSLSPSYVVPHQMQ